MAEKRVITLVCMECKHENYITEKNPKMHPDRLERKKYCPNCNTSTTHREKKK